MTNLISQSSPSLSSPLLSSEFSAQPSPQSSSQFSAQPCSQSSTPLHVIILAAGKGTRMRSALPKVLHKIGDKSLLTHVILAAQELRPTTIHVVHDCEHGVLLQKEMHQQLRCDENYNDACSNALLPSQLRLNWVLQQEQLGTGHAVQQVLPHLFGMRAGACAHGQNECDAQSDEKNIQENTQENARVLILYGDVPLIQTSTLRALLSAAEAMAAITLLTCNLSDPTGYGRIVRAADNKKYAEKNIAQEEQKIAMSTGIKEKVEKQVEEKVEEKLKEKVARKDTINMIKAIVEEKDASLLERQITEVNTGILCTTAQLLQRYLPRLQTHNLQREYYLTDIVALAIADGCMVNNVYATTVEEMQGINDKQQLAQLERCYQLRVATQLMRQQGVTLRDPARFDVRGYVECAQDVTIDVNVVIEGHVYIGANTTIGANCCLKDVTIGARVTIKPHCVIEGAVIADDCVIGPFARIRPTSHIMRGAHVGNFVEVKNAELGVGSKASHLTYLGDATIGANVNIGAGTITCNYDGVNKYRTIVEDGVFIGSNSQLVAPVTIGRNATIGAGSTITHDAPAEKLTLARARQVTIDGWQRPLKNSLKNESKKSD